MLYISTDFIEVLFWAEVRSYPCIYNPFIHIFDNIVIGPGIERLYNIVITVHMGEHDDGEWFQVWRRWPDKAADLYAA